ncbi:multiple sugar transport system substrate-binding protein [Kaistia hirudinis]|uniref:Multiple sugar transport system substrate-binding protein n=2 Tax=Kaistia hirudinis TaxID=1293440 RepID=A0A840AGV8_9HYPH|nr:sugar ABC transporter substrate-binding protein [Kaistia hirudinis]MBB3929390.1 multiple sugar transport system substrate-binding protein [Kaistia hirudinis]
MMHKTGTRRVLSLLAGAAALVGMSTASDAATIRVVLGYYSAATQGLFEEMAKDYMSKHPGDEVKIEVIQWDNLQQRLTTDIAGGTAPDISMIGTRWLLDYVKNDIAEPMDSYITPEFKAGFIDAFLAPSTLDGKLYGLPIAASARAMYYNKDLLAKAGVNEPPANWDGVVDTAKKIKALGGDSYGFALQGKEIETDAYWYYSLWTHGGEIIKDGKSGVASPEAVAALTLYKSMIDDGLTEPDPTGLNRQDIERLFKQGRVGMILTGPWLRGQIKDEAPTLNYGIAPIPEGTTKATYGVTDTLMVFKSSPNKELAMKFLTETVFTPEWRIKFSKAEGFLPVMKEEAKAFADDPQLKAFTDMLAYAHFAPAVANWEQMVDAIIAALQKTYTGQSQPEPALKEAAATIDGLLQQ